MIVRPPSVTDMRINLVGLLGMCAATAWLLQYQVHPDTSFPILMLATVGPILLLDLLVLKVYQRESTGLDFSSFRPDAGRLLTKLLGAAAVVGAVAGLYWLAPEYQGEFYGPFYLFVRNYGPPALILSVIYLSIIDGYTVQPKDGYWHLGAALTGRFREVELDKVGELARAWLIKGFFVPLMFVYGHGNVRSLVRAVYDGPDGFVGWFEVGWHFGFLVDIAFTTAGYLATMRLFDTHVRSSEPTMKGWVVALFCYQPFFSLFSAQYVHYEDGYQWGEWLAPYPTLKAIWGIAILLLLAVFSGSTVTFGARFSNLTHRGVLTNGFYSLTKHPAYISKCSSYWLLYIPYIYNGSVHEVVRDCFWLSFLCFIYFMRAKTEEAHLSRDPAYVHYALSMNERSIFAPLGRIFPFLVYRPPL